MSAQYIFTMHRLTRTFPPDKTVVKDLTLAFLPGAKIGVLGYNGAGKSTVLRIMAGQERDFRGDAMLAPDATVGLLEQEPHLDDSKDVRGNVEDGVAATRARHPVRGQLLELAGAEAGPPRAGGAQREGAPEDDRRRARLGAPEPEGPPDEAEGAPAELRGPRRPGAQRQARRGPDPHPGRP